MAVNALAAAPEAHVPDDEPSARRQGVGAFDQPRALATWTASASATGPMTGMKRLPVFP